MLIGMAILNVLLVLLISPLLEGVMRKLKAVIHSRKGPPIIQPYLDILKLLGKEELRPSGSVLFWMAPPLCLAAVLVTALLVPMGGPAPLGFAGDIIALLYFTGMAAVAVILGAFASGNPYAYLGAGREMMMVLTVEPVMAVALVVSAIKAHSLTIDQLAGWQLAHGTSVSLVVAGVAFLLALQAHLGKLPFDIPEADQEIMEGPFMEQSGPGLALFKLAMYGKQLIFASLFLQVFVPWPKLGMVGPDVVINLAKVLVLVLIVGVVDAVNPRLRIDQSMNYFARVVIFVAVAALAFAIVGV